MATATIEAPASGLGLSEQEFNNLKRNVKRALARRVTTPNKQWKVPLSDFLVMYLTERSFVWSMLEADPQPIHADPDLVRITCEMVNGLYPNAILMDRYEDRNGDA